MKKLMILGFVGTLLCISCQDDNITGTGPIVTEEITIDNFVGIETYGDDIVNITYGDIQKVTVTGHSNIIDKLERDVQEGIWDIELENGSYRNAQLTINIVMSKLNYIELVGSGNVDVANFKSDTNVEISIYGSGNISLNGNSGCENLDVYIEGSGVIYDMDDFVDLVNSEIKIEGSGAYNGFPNSTVNCEVNIIGSGICNVNVETLLDVKISGTGVVNYKGYPTIKTDITGLGEVNDYND